VRKHLAESVLAGVPLFSIPAFLIGHTSWNTTSMALALLALTAAATVFSLLVFIRLEPASSRSGAIDAQR
jgi:hypothetical protein